MLLWLSFGCEKWKHDTDGRGSFVLTHLIDACFDIQDYAAFDQSIIIVCWCALGKRLYGSLVVWFSLVAPSCVILWNGGDTKLFIKGHTLFLFCSNFDHDYFHCTECVFCFHSRIFMVSLFFFFGVHSADMLAFISACALTRTIMSWRSLKLFTTLSRYWTATLEVWGLNWSSVVL